MGKDMEVIPLTIDENPFLDYLVAFLGIGVCLFKALVGSHVVIAVLDQVLPGGPEHGKHLGSIEDTGVPVDLRRAVQLEVERRGIFRFEGGESLDLPCLVDIREVGDWCYMECHRKGPGCQELP